MLPPHPTWHLGLLLSIHLSVIKSVQNSVVGVSMFFGHISSSYHAVYFLQMVNVQREKTQQIKASVEEKLFLLRQCGELLKFHSRSKMILIHNTGEEQLSNDPAIESKVVRCGSEKFSMLLGRALCASLTYANVTGSQSHAYFPLSGPFSFSTTMSKVDGYVHVLSLCLEIYIIII